MKDRYLILVLAIEVIAGATLLHWNELVAWADLHPNMAAWVQAFGSIGAILMAVWSVNRSHELQTLAKNQEAFDENTRTLAVVFQLVGGAALIARKIFDLGKNVRPTTSEELAMMGIELDAFADAVHRLDPSRLDRYEFIEAALVAEMMLRRLRDAVNRVQFWTPHPPKPVYLQVVANMAHQELEARAKKLLNILEKRGLANTNDVRPR